MDNISTFDLSQAQEEYMNQQQRTFFRKKLLAWREKLIQESENALKRLRQSEHKGGDLIDRSVHDHNQVYDFLARRRNEEMIQKINAALKRLDNGTFGYCLESGEEIGLERLLAYPVATLSVEAQEFIERARPNAGRDALAM